MTKHTHTHARKLTQELLTRKLTHTHAHTHAHTHTRAHIHIYAHTQVLPTNTHPGVPFSKVMWWMTEVVMPSLAIVSNIHTHKRTHIHTYIRAHTYTRTHRYCLQTLTLAFLFPR